MIEKLIKDHFSQIRQTCRVYAFKYHVEYETLLGGVLEKAWRYRARFEFRGDKSFVNWMGFLIKNYAIDIHREKKGVKLMDIEDAYGIGCREKDLSDSDMLNRVFEYVRTMFGEREYNIVIMVSQGYKYEDIAEIMNLNLGTMKATLFRVRKKLIEEREKLGAV